MSLVGRGRVDVSDVTAEDSGASFGEAGEVHFDGCLGFEPRVVRQRRMKVTATWWKASMAAVGGV